MKILFLGLFLLVSTGAFAADFCVGEPVLSSNGIYGQVVGIYSSTGQLSVKYVTMADPISQDPANLAHLSGGVGDFSVGDQAISSNGIYGQVVGVYSNGQLAVKYSTMTDPLAQNVGALAHLSGRVSDFSVGDQVLSSNGIYGQVVAIYEDGQLAVKYVTMTDPIGQDAPNLAYLHGQSNGFSVGQNVISSNGIYGQVVGIYENGQLAVKYSTMTDPIAQNAGDLAVEGGCTGTCP